MKIGFRGPWGEYDGNRTGSASVRCHGDDIVARVSGRVINAHLPIEWEERPLVAAESFRAGRAVRSKSDNRDRHAGGRSCGELYDGDQSAGRLRIDGAAHEDVAARNCGEWAGNDKKENQEA